MRFPTLLSIVIAGLSVGPAPLLLSRARAADSEESPNACGCYRTGAGLCYCAKKAKCGCPGECEPKGCEEKRAKEMEKEIREETRKAEQASRAKDKERADPDEAGAAPKAAAPAAKQAAVHEEKPERPAKPEKEKPAKPKLSAAQRRDLARLLDAYLADHPEAAQKTVDQARREIVQ